MGFILRPTSHLLGLGQWDKSLAVTTILFSILKFTTALALFIYLHLFQNYKMKNLFVISLFSISFLFAQERSQEFLSGRLVKSIEDTEMFEFSTEHFDEDSIRIEKGD